jgi:cell division protein FtsI/penicillin-binding protein 2
VQVGTRAFQNFDSKNQGTMNMNKAIAVSCDTIWYQIAFDEWLRDGGLRPKASPNDYFFKAAQSFKITQKVGIDLPTESTSRLADRTYKKSWYEQLQQWLDTLFAPQGGTQFMERLTQATEIQAALSYKILSQLRASAPQAPRR